MPTYKAAAAIQSFLMGIVNVLGDSETMRLVNEMTGKMWHLIILLINKFIDQLPTLS